MTQNSNFRSKQVATLSLYDLKAKKKTIPFKIFHNLPLTYTESMELEFKRKSIDQNFYSRTMGEEEEPNEFKKTRNYRTSINKLATPLKPRNNGNSEVNAIGKIIINCDSLMKKVLTKNRIGKIKHKSNKDFRNLLVQTSTFSQGQGIIS